MSVLPTLNLICVFISSVVACLVFLSNTFDRKSRFFCGGINIIAAILNVCAFFDFTILFFVMPITAALILRLIYTDGKIFSNPRSERITSDDLKKFNNLL